MIPPIEEVKRVADTVGALRFENYSETNFTDSQLQAFAQHYKEEGKPKWISTDANLPPDETPVLVQFYDGKIKIAELRWDKPSFEDTYPAYQYWDSPEDDGKDWEWSDIVSWMPLPSATTQENRT